VCTSLRPSHPGSPSSGNGGYLITTNIPANAAGTGYEYTPNTEYTGISYVVTVQAIFSKTCVYFAVNLRGTVNTFKGFAVQSVSVPNESPMGTFVPEIGNNNFLLECSPRGVRRGFKG
jgi:hypothetical protein